jgi:ADP-heptose:LPS heptosyltransferase
MTHRTLIVKLGAIGDVALCCRALQELARSSRETEFHWVIDSTLLPLARKLAPSSVQWHPFDSKKLFSGSLLEKAAASLRLIRIAREVRPEQVLILHRDDRYRFLLKPFVKGKLKQLGRSHGQHELDAYREAFEIRGAADDGGVAIARAVEKRIGVLVGGAQNAKTSFLEKRWPLLNIRELIEKIPATHRVALFGAPEDEALARELLSSLGERAGLVDNRVGKIPLEALPEALASLEALVTVDSGPAHIAASVMTEPTQKIVCLFGPTDPKIWAPRAAGRAKVIVLRKELECSPCYRDDGNFVPCQFTGEDFQKCMKRIGASEVLRALEL